VARFNRNRLAIETLNAIRDSDRPATREEQAKLAAYTGWGSFGQDLFKGTWERPDPRPGWEERDRWLREHLGRQAWESAQASILNAHYTDPPVVLAMWDMVRRAGFEGGRVLEPSMGTGNFFSLMPLDLNPVAPPGWLRIGTPRESTVFWGGKPFTVTGHRWNKDGWFVLAEDDRGGVVIPYMEATDQQGIPAYEKREFTSPVVVDTKAQGQQQPTARASMPDRPPVVATLTGDEIQGEDMRRRLAAARVWLNANLRGRSIFSAALNAPVVVNRRGVEKTLSRVGDRIVDGIPAIEAIIASGQFAGEEAPRPGKADTTAKRYVRLEGRVAVAGEERVYRVLLREDNNGTFHYKLEAERSEIDEGPEPAASIPPAWKAGDLAAGPGPGINLEEVRSKVKIPDGWGVAGEMDIERLTPAAEVALRDILRVIAGPEAVLELGTTGDTNGIAAGPLVRLSLNLAADKAEWTVHHEAIHTLRNLGKITDAEWKILTEAAAAEGWAARFRIGNRYNDMGDEIQMEEAVAEAFGAWATGNLDSASAPVARIFQKIRQFLARLRNALAGRGFKDARSIFQAIQAGEMGARAAKPDASRGGNRSADMVSAQLDKRVARGDFDWLDDGTIRASMPEVKDALRRAGQILRDENIGVVKRLWQGAPLPIGVTADRQGGAINGPIPILSTLIPPDALFKKWPPLAALVNQGIAAEQRMSIWTTRMEGQMTRILGDLKAAKGDFAAVADTLLLADADEVDIENQATAAAFYAEQGLAPAEAKAAAAINRLLVQVARLVDQHRRAMLPKVQQRKAEVWARMQQIMATAKPGDPDYASLYRRRAYLNKRIRDGKGDLAAHSREVETINGQLRAMRLADPDIQERLTELREEYDALEARLAATSVRRKKGYFPHKFFGSWRMFEITDEVDDQGEPVRVEITSDQGFYDTRGQAIAAARDYQAQHPDARLHIEPKVTTFPPGSLGGAVLSDAAYNRLRRGLEASAGLEGDALNDALKGVARKRSRRRVFSAAMKRTGAEGFSEDIERVVRSHIAASTRYVEMDKLKFAYVSTTEKMGLSPGRATAVRLEGREELQRAIEAWFRDVNGSKQQGETIVDNLLQRMGLPASTLAAAALGYAAGGPIGLPLAGYVGYRMAQAMRKGGDFPTRTLMGGITNHMAHAKLGMLLNVSSAVVNLTQTLVNTYPVLGEKWTAIGIQRAVAALYSQAINKNAPGRMSGDALLLQRADIQTKYNQTNDTGLLVQDTGILAKMKTISMFAFQGVETLNRATAFLGAYARAEAEGKMPGPALQEARAVMQRTQFHQGNAARAELMRNTLLRVPLQFKNFMVQQIAFVLGLRKEDSKWFDPRGYATPEFGRFAMTLFLVAGALGLAGLQLLDWLVKAFSGYSPVLELKDWIIRAGGSGELASTAADVLARGLPALLGVDISGRVGMGAGFLPDQGSDLTGPFVGTVTQLRTAAANGGQLVDYLNALSPAANPLRALEAAANGASITSSRFWTGGVFRDGESRMTNPRMRDQTEYRPTDGELARTALGFRPLRQSLQADQREIQREENQERQQKVQGYLSRMIQAMWDGNLDQVGAIAREASAAGVQIKESTIETALKNAQLERSQRDIRRAPMDLRPGVVERQRAIEAR